MNKNPSETSEQVAVAKLLRAARPKILWTATANGGERHLKTAIALKASGVQAGVPDLLIFSPPPVGGWVGAAIEMKRRGAPPSAWEDHQREWASDLVGCGWWAGVAYGSDEAIELLRALGYRL